MGADRGATIVKQEKPDKITGFIDAISQIEGYYVMENQSGGIPAHLYTTKLGIEYGMVGLKSVLGTTLLSLILTPLCVGVWEKVLPVYGSHSPGTTDNILAFLLTISFTVGYAVFAARLGGKYEGEFTKKMIKNFMMGIGVGVILKIFIALAVFHYLALVVLDPVNWENLLLKMQGVFGWTILNWLYVQGLQFRTVFIVSAWFMTIMSLCLFFIPLCAIGLKKWSDKMRNDLGGKRM